MRKVVGEHSVHSLNPLWAAKYLADIGDTISFCQGKSRVPDNASLSVKKRLFVSRPTRNLGLTGLFPHAGVESQVRFSELRGRAD